LKVLQSTRAATSTGADLDSWMLDFGVTRLPAKPATGNVAFSRLSSAAAATIPVGTAVRTADGSQLFSVTADTSNQYWSASANAYVLPVGAPTLTVPVQAQQPGTQGNIQAGAIGLVASPLPFVDTATNPTPFVNGMDAETDDALRARFQNFLASRSRATVAAVSYAISSLQQGLDFVINENMDATGSARIGSFVVIVDDGTGSPPQALLDTVYAAIDQVRPIGSTFSVHAPVEQQISVSLQIDTAAGQDPNAIRSSASSAISRYINALGIGTTLPVTKVAQVVYEAIPGITNVRAIMLNGQAADIVPAWNQVVRTASVAVD
jgi:uncharacterized phage protein gp47/JayE